MEVWVFHGQEARLASGVFSTREQAENWIRRYGLTGLLTSYPLGEGMYDWAVTNTPFRAKRADQTTPGFIGRFTSAYRPHEHFREGRGSTEREDT
ncbi:DUF7710 domain-containing protein [Deinococcus radiotolerans]|uniref:DUF7710 domain-containing protein n=1 Tax=Deinococcus radiotolerans TaxID=1309407 RepID=A0ABQ2FMW1_9DEIO|nr:hypothetical protein [Deinococcus radiotolerans]GGL06811.1 hypothetical protein GCM10010844_27020 [Deinococcus radiotolerans]